MILNKEDYNLISEIVFKEDYPGYIQNVIESPNGDGVFDDKKQYAHVSLKYLVNYSNEHNKNILKHYLNRSIIEANRICTILNIDKKFWCGEDSTMRILKYPVGAVTHPHTDFDLFTLCLYRNITETFKYLDDSEPELLKFAKQNSDGIHFGELMTELNGVQATKHEVVSCNEVQNSIVFFSVPNHKSVLPAGVSVGDWILERKSRSRKVI